LEKKIINISSVGGAISSSYGGGSPSPNTIAYRLSKAALNMLTAIYASILKNDNIVVVAINPGGVITQSVVKFLGEKASEANGWMKPETAATRVLKIVDYVTMVDSGKFINHRFLDELDAKEYKVYYSW